MINQINELIGNIDQLVYWLRNNPNIAIPAREKKRLVSIVHKVTTSEEISDDEWAAIKPRPKSIKTSNTYNYIKPKKETKTIPKKKVGEKKLILPLKPIQKKKKEINIVVRNGKKYVVCPSCNAVVKNIVKHRKKCLPRFTGKIMNKTKVELAKQKEHIKPNSITNAAKEYKAERNLDGSRDFWKIRDKGKFGSHSSYDDMGDESTS